MMGKSIDKVPQGRRTNWMGHTSHALCNELIARRVYQYGDAPQGKAEMAAKLSVWEANLWIGFEESEDLVIFADKQWRQSALEVRNDANKMGVMVVKQEKSHCIHAMLVKMNKEKSAVRNKKKNEAAAPLLVQSMALSSRHSISSREKLHEVLGKINTVTSSH
jgi:hypothetical protein